MIYYITNESIDNFKDRNKLIYVGIENKILTNEEKKAQNKTELYRDTTVYESDLPFVGFPIRQGNTIRPATRVELIRIGVQDLFEGEYIKGDEIVKIEKPSHQYKWNFETNKWEIDLDRLIEGEYVEKGEIKYKAKPDNMVKPFWNKDTNSWIETGSPTELKDKYFELINNFKLKISEEGFIYTHRDGKKYKQKSRTYKDSPLLTNTKSFLERHRDKEVFWSFDDYNAVPMNLEDIYKLEDTGVIFNNCVFQIERELKKGEVNLGLTYSEFKELVENKILTMGI